MFNFFNRHQKDVLFVCSASVDEIWIRSTVLESISSGLSVALAVCDTNNKSHRFIENTYAGLDINLYFGVSLKKAAKIKSKAVVTASSGLTRDIFPTTSNIFVHMPHSFASLHVIYPEGAFNGYNYIFAVGPHHVEEFNQIKSKNRLTESKVIMVGYGKLDILRSCQVYEPLGKHVLIAPSWGEGNLLEVCGIELVLALLNEGWKVTVRPHPIFFLENAPILKSFFQLESSYENLKIESSLDGDGGIHSASVMVGDYSGASFEFAVLRRRPVISVNVPRKIVNDNWVNYELEPMEVRGRVLLGPVVEPNADAILKAISSNISSIEDKDVSKFLFDDGATCASRAVRLLKQLISNHKAKFNPI